jgi:hypothetical protein
MMDKCTLSQFQGHLTLQTYPFNQEFFKKKLHAIE